MSEASMKKEPIFTASRLCELVRYEPDTGALFWQPRTESDFLCAEKHRARVLKSWNAKYANQIINSRTKEGRVIVHFNLGQRWRTSGARVAWTIHHRTWPQGLVDHIDGDCTNDRISNLREVSSSQNNRNQKISRRNTSGKVGVTFYRRTGQWRAWIRMDGKTHSLGYFDKIDDAIAARVRAENQHGFFEATRKSEVWRWK